MIETVQREIKHSNYIIHFHMAWKYFIPKFEGEQKKCIKKMNEWMNYLTISKKIQSAQNLAIHTHNVQTTYLESDTQAC